MQTETIERQCFFAGLLISFIAYYLLRYRVGTKPNQPVDRASRDQWWLPECAGFGVVSWVISGQLAYAATFLILEYSRLNYLYFTTQILFWGPILFPHVCWWLIKKVDKALDKSFGIWS